MSVAHARRTDGSRQLHGAPLELRRPRHRVRSAPADLPADPWSSRRVPNSTSESLRSFGCKRQPYRGVKGSSIALTCSEALADSAGECLTGCSMTRGANNDTGFQAQAQGVPAVGHLAWVGEATGPSFHGAGTDPRGRMLWCCLEAEQGMDAFSELACPCA